MDYHKYYEENKEKLIPILNELEYTPHKLVLEASKDGISVYEFIYILLNEYI